MAFLHSTATKVVALKEKRSLLPYLLLAPGMLWLTFFFIFPIINLAQTSTQTKKANGDIGQYEQTLRFRNYIDAFLDNKEQSLAPLFMHFLPQFLLLPLRIHLRMGLLSALANLRTSFLYSLSHLSLPRFFSAPLHGNKSLEKKVLLLLYSEGCTSSARKRRSPLVRSLWLPV